MTNTGKPRVLIVDDSEAVLAASRALLESAGLEVVSVAAPIGATLKVIETMPDLVLTDVNMASMPGDRVVKRIKTSPRMRHIPVLLYSERPERDLEKIAKRCGADGYISKSTGPSAFTSHVLAHLKTRQRVMVIDDSAAVVAACAVVLQNAGFRVATETSPDEAKDKVASDQPDFILMDVAMPGITGDELVRQIKADPSMSKIPVFLYSERPADELRKISKKCGADGYVHKSEAKRDLVERIRSFLEKP